MILSEEHKRSLRDIEGDIDNDSDTNLQACLKESDNSTRAIVKELLPPAEAFGTNKPSMLELLDVAFKKEMIPGMIRNLRGLNRIGIFVRDVVRENYRNGVLFDFSNAWTVPHPNLTSHIVEKIMDVSTGPHIDAWQLDELIDAWNKVHPHEEPIVCYSFCFRDSYRQFNQLISISERPAHACL